MCKGIAKMNRTVKPATAKPRQARRPPLPEMLRLTGQRQRGFKFMIAHLRACEKPVIVETGCARIEDNFKGDGQSTLIFDAVAEELNGSVHSVDIDPNSVRMALSKVGPRTKVHCGDSVAWLGRAKGKADLLYLDSFDFDENDPWPSMSHHMQELAAAMHLLKPGSLVAVDDNFRSPEGLTGKGVIVSEFFERVGIPLVLDDYQRIWKIPNRR